MIFTRFGPYLFILILEDEPYNGEPRIWGNLILKLGKNLYSFEGFRGFRYYYCVLDANIAVGAFEHEELHE